MFQPDAPGLILIAMVMAMVRTAIKPGTFSLALADHIGSIIPCIHLKSVDMALNPKK